MSEATDSEWFDSMDWVPLSETKQWAAKCIGSPASLTTLLGLLWRQVSWIQQQVAEWERVEADSELLLAVSDILAAWSVEINRKQGQGISPQPAIEFAFLARRLNGTVPGSATREATFQAIDRLSALLRFLMLNFGESEPEAVAVPGDEEPTELVAAPARRRHGDWTKSEQPPNSLTWWRQFHQPIIATQGEICLAMDITEKTLRSRASRGEIHVMMDGKRAKENILRCWFRDDSLHAEILDQIERNRKRQHPER
ncbi:hypothetical protein [Planctomicrobium sp. SH527]|uniref:hypothetical protein n=1 Tax=Planctomicrobium sp. SH527 TaxID=3448123 RepID=UPI003F5B4A91